MDPKSFEAIEISNYVYRGHHKDFSIKETKALHYLCCSRFYEAEKMRNSNETDFTYGTVRFCAHCTLLFGIGRLVG
jgi:hypothetical protein